MVKTVPKKLKLTKRTEVKHIIITVRMNDDEMKNILNKAHFYTGGNVSEFLRFASLNFRPAKGDFQK